MDGHVNESRTLKLNHRRVQQQGESFDDFLISLRELVKICNFCSEACTQKSIRDQIIEDLRDADAIEDLLQMSNLTLTATVAKCQKAMEKLEWLSYCTSTPCGSLHKFYPLNVMTRMTVRMTVMIKMLPTNRRTSKRSKRCAVMNLN